CECSKRIRDHCWSLKEKMGESSGDCHSDDTLSTLRERLAHRLERELSHDDNAANEHGHRWKHYNSKHRCPIYSSLDNSHLGVVVGIEELGCVPAG
ncbi:hypothetical protein PENTCL1PPCAC_27893, partial [Pristionchus entomophagus]